MNHNNNNNNYNRRTILRIKIDYIWSVVRNGASCSSNAHWSKRTDERKQIKLNVLNNIAHLHKFEIRLYRNIHWTDQSPVTRREWNILIYSFSFTSFLFTIFYQLHFFFIFLLMPFFSSPLIFNVHMYLDTIVRTSEYDHLL